MMSKYTGGCKCGNITYIVNGEAQWKVSCHCNWCQTTSGAAFRTFVLFNESDLEIFGETLESYKDSDTEHGRPMINQFCSECGTQLGIKVPSMDARHIALGTLDQRKEIAIKDNIWWQESLDFVSFPSDSDVYKTGFWNGTGERILKPQNSFMSTPWKVTLAVIKDRAGSASCNLLKKYVPKDYIASTYK